MIKIILLITFLFLGNCPLKADDLAGNIDQEFMDELNSVKNPFENGIPKPVVIAPKPVVQAPVSIPKPKPVRPIPVIIRLPSLDLQGVVVGDGVYEAIINDQVVPLNGRIGGARVIAVTKQGVSLLFRGKKFFLRVD